MDEGNNFCASENCSNLASAFAIKGSLKIKSCDQHLPSLLKKSTAVFDIEGYEFISVPQDAVVFNERKAEVEKGLHNLAVQEANIEEQREAALRLIESEKEALLKTFDLLFVEIKEAVSKRHCELKQQFSSFATNFKQYLKNREAVLVPSAELLCREVRATPSFFQLVVSGVSGHVVRDIKKYWFASTVEAELLLRIAASVSSETATVESAREYNQKGDQFKSAKQWKEAEENYLQAKAIYEKCAPQSTDAATNLDDLGSLLRDSERWSEAEMCHRQAQAIFERTNPQCEEAARNHINYGLLCFDLNRIDEAEQRYQESKSICERAGIDIQILAHALKGLGFVRKNQERYSEAAEFFRQAQPIFEDTEPQSNCAASNYFELGYMYLQLERWKESEESLLRAKLIYEATAPQTSDFANCLYNLGIAYEAQSRFEESLASFLSAGELYVLNNDDKSRTDSGNSILRVQVKRTKSSI